MKKIILLVLVILSFATVVNAASMTTRSLMDEDTANDNVTLKNGRNLIVEGTLVGGYPGAIQGLDLSYSGTLSVNVKPGWAHCKDKFITQTAILTETLATTDLSVGGFTYVYIDYSESTTSSLDLTVSRTAPTWSDAYNGFYYVDDRCIGIVYASAGPVITNFIADGGDYAVYAVYSLSYNTNPNGAFQDTTVSFGAFAPVNAIKASFYVSGYDADGNVDSRVAAKEVGQGPRVFGEHRAATTFDIILGPSRNVVIFGNDIEDNTKVCSWWGDLTIRR